MKTNKRITWFLSALVFGIWGLIFYLVVEAVGRENTPSDISAQKIRLVGEPSSEKFRFENDIRDPFQFKPERSRVKKSKEAIHVVLLVPPPFKLSGIVLNNQKRVAVLESPDGATYFVTEGETINGVKLVKIMERTVTYRYMNQTKDWAISH